MTRPPHEWNSTDIALYSMGKMDMTDDTKGRVSANLPQSTGAVMDGYDQFWSVIDEGDGKPTHANPDPEPQIGVTRLEVIDETGRAYTRTGVSVTLSRQDEGRTLKAFVREASHE